MGQTLFYGRVGSDFNLYRLESMTPPNSVNHANCNMTHDDELPPGLELTHNASISGIPTLAGDYYYHIKFDDISYSYIDSNGVRQEVKADDEPITLHIIIRDSLAKTLVGHWKGNSVDDTINIEYHNSDLTYKQGAPYDIGTDFQDPKYISIGADNSINLLGWYSDGTSRTFYLQDNQSLTTSQTSKYTKDNTYQANTYTRGQ